MKRKPPTLREMLAAAVAQIAGIPRDHLKAMHVDQILSLIEVDHDPVPIAVAVPLGWTAAQYNHPSNLTIRLKADHRWKTAKKDQPAIAKSDRLSPEHEAFQRRMLAKSGQTSDSDVATTEAKPRAKMKSRGFQKAPEGHKHFQRRKAR